MIYRGIVIEGGCVSAISRVIDQIDWRERIYMITAEELDRDYPTVSIVWRKGLKPPQPYIDELNDLFGEVCLNFVTDEHDSEFAVYVGQK